MSAPTLTSTIWIHHQSQLIQNHLRDVPTRWRDLLFYIKKGANWSFPLGVEGIKSDFIRFMCDTLYYMNPRRRKKNIGISDKKDFYLSVN